MFAFLLISLTLAISCSRSIACVLMCYLLRSENETSDFFVSDKTKEILSVRFTAASNDTFSDNSSHVLKVHPDL